MEIPLVTFGVIADVQYADTDDRLNYRKTRWRYYRGSLDNLQQAITHFSQRENGIDFVVQLGDLIDGLNRRSPGGSTTALQRVVAVLKGFSSGPLLHVWGNHELYNHSRDDLHQSELFTPAVCKDVEREVVGHKLACYHYSPVSGLRVVVLDHYDISVLGRPYDSVEHRQAMDLLKKKNPNHNDLNSPQGLEGSERRFVKFNGAIGQEQLRWLEGVLQRSEDQKENVIVMGHVPIYEPSANPMFISWNNTEMLSTLQRHPCVKVYIAGHDHQGGYGLDDHGIHHVTFPGVIESQVGQCPFGVVRAYGDKLEIEGHGEVPSRTLNYCRK